MNRKKSFIIVFGLILALAAGIVCCWLWQRSAGSSYPEDACSWETEILEVFLREDPEKRVQVTLRVAKEGGYDNVLLDDDTVLLDSLGRRLDYEDLKVGQKIFVTAKDEVMYNAVVHDPESGYTNPSVNIYYMCYEVRVTD